MKIVLYVNSFLPQIGGKELVVHYLAQALYQLGHEVRVIGPGRWWKDRGIVFGYPVFRYPILTRKLPELVKLSQLSLDLLINGCDVIHAHVTYPCGYLAARVKGLLSVPLVITPHGVDIHVIPEIGHGLRLDPELAKKIGYALEKADALTAISASVVASLKDAGAPANKIITVSNGVDFERFGSGSGQSVRNWLCIPESARLLVAVGNYHPRKGHELMVKAMPQILEAEPLAHLVIVGRDNDVLSPLIDNLGLHGKVICPGELKFPINITTSGNNGANQTDLLANLYAAAEIFISAGISEGAEGLSLALLEAMAAGLTVVGSNISGNRDIVINRENGVLVEPGDVNGLALTIIDILRTPSSDLKMGQMAKSTAEQYRWEFIAQQYLKVYQSVCH